MSKTASKESSVLQRCAVCKIDLKGRFSFIDQEFMELTGYSDEELLGKSVSAFLEPASRELVNKLINERSHYETVYDSAPLTLLNKKQEAVNVSATMFLNFIGGNPVNFQLILSSHAVPERMKAADPRSIVDDRYSKFVNELVSLESNKDWQKIVDLVLHFSSAGQAALYRYEKQALVPMATATDDTQAKFTGNKISDVTELHAKVAQSEQDYIFTDEQSVQKAVENSKAAPNEFITAIELGTNRYVLRLVYDNEIDSTQAVDSVERAKLAGKILSKLLSGSNPQLATNGESDSEISEENLISSDLLFLRDLTAGLEGSLDTIHSVSEKLGHNFYNELGKDGNNLLSGLSADSKAIANLLSQLKEVFALLRQNTPKETSDLNLVLKQVLQEILIEYPKLQLNCSYDNLPKCELQREKVQNALKYLLKGCIRLNDFQKGKFKVETVTSGDILEIILTDSLLKLSEKELSHLFELSHPLSITGQGQPNSKKITELAIARLIVDHVGGMLDAEEISEKGTKFIITLPV